MPNITVSICQSNYIPWRGYFDLIGLADYFVIYDSVQYTKRDWRNRNTIKTINGLLWLSIPCKSKSFTQKINETEINIDDKFWAKKHLSSIYHNYSKANHFSSVYPWIENIYLHKILDLTLLSDINKILITEICNFLEIKTKIITDTSLELIEGKSEKLLHICKQLNASTYLSGPAAKDYLDVEVFKATNMNVKWMDYSNYPQYQQLHGEFIPNISILDLLFNEGSNAKSFLKSNNKC